MMILQFYYYFLVPLDLKTFGLDVLNGLLIDVLDARFGRCFDPGES
jgi:hypothetical protein